MQYFLQNPDKPSVIAAPMELVEIDILDAPVYATKIDISRISNRGMNSYVKKELFSIMYAIFRLKGIAGGEKSEAVKFLLKPENLERIKYNNMLLDMRKQRGL